MTYLLPLEVWLFSGIKIICNLSLIEQGGAGKKCIKVMREKGALFSVHRVIVEKCIFVLKYTC